MTTSETTTNAPAVAARTPDRPERRHFWARPHRDGLPDGKELAALRGGLSAEAGSVPAMWRYYTTLNADGRLSTALRAEHAALALFAVHQQSQKTLMHHPGTGLGSAMLALRNSDRFSTDAIDRRFTAAATATSFPELVAHLRGLVSQLRTLRPAQPVDYTQLFDDLRRWQDPREVPRIRRRWGSQYFAQRHTPVVPSPRSVPSA